jgi:hypothetical protein
MAIIEEIFPTAPMYSDRVKGATPPSGWFLKYISGMDDKSGINRGDWLARFSEHGEDDYSFSFAAEMSFGRFWKTEAEAGAVSKKLRRVGVETEVVNIASAN